MWLTIASDPERGKIVKVDKERFTVGRAPECDLLLSSDRKVSALHASIELLDDGRAIIHDAGSTNGTLVDGKRIELPEMLRGGEQLQLGDTLIWVSTSDPSRYQARPVARPTERTQRAAEDSPPARPGLEAAAKPAREDQVGQSTLQRLRLRRSTRLATALSGVAIVLVVGMVGLFVSGVLPAGDDDAKVDTAALTTSEVVAAVAPSVVRVVVRRVDGQGGGTGWVLDAKEGTIVTNSHVVAGATSLSVVTGDGERAAERLAVDTCEDLAVLKVADTSGLVAMPLGSQSDLRLGEQVVAVGFPTSASSHHDLTATSGVVSVVQTSLRGGGPIPDLPNVVQTDAAINPGSSGGPLLSTRGVLVGVNTSTLASAGGRSLQNSNYAIGVDRVKEVVAELRLGHSSAWNGMALAVPTPSDLAASGLPTRSGLLITAAVPGSPASTAGLGRGSMILIGVDDQRLDGSMASYCAAVRGRKAGESARLTVITPNRAQPTEVVVAFG